MRRLFLVLPSLLIAICGARAQSAGPFAHRNFDIRFTEVQVKPWERAPEFLAMNPSGLTPVLVETHDGESVVIAESRAKDVHVARDIRGSHVRDQLR